MSQDLVSNSNSRFKSQTLYKQTTCKVLDTWGLMYAKSNFYDSTNIFKVPSTLQCNITWNLGANVCSSASLSRLSQSIKYFEYGLKTILKYRFIYDQNESALGDYRWGFVLLKSRKDSKVKVPAYISKSTGYSGSLIIWRLGGWRNTDKPEKCTSYFNCSCLTISISESRLEFTWLR